LIEFNFKTRQPEEVNWYLRRNVGCTRSTRDGLNWLFAGAKRGVIYIPPPATAPPDRIVHSIAATSWIDQRLFDPKDLPEVDHYFRTPDKVDRSLLTANSGYRFANFLEAYVLVDEQGQITDQGFTNDSDVYIGPSYKGLMPKAFPALRRIEDSPDKKSVHFVQIVGAQTRSPQIIGSREAVKVVDALLGTMPGWGGPFGVQIENSGSQLGVKVAENMRVFPPIWSQLELTISSDASFHGKLVSYSAFPSNSAYLQSYSLESLNFNTSKYDLVQTYDGRSRIDDWRKKGWGPPDRPTGSSGGNPWMVPDPRVFGRDFPFRPSPPAY
jgi:hypothetical protein